MGPCRFGCRALGATDSLEHYACCRIIWEVGTTYAAIPAHCSRKPSYFLMMRDDHQSVITDTAWLVYAAMSTYDQLRYDGALTAMIYDNWDPLMDTPLPPLPPSSPLPGCAVHCMRVHLSLHRRSGMGRKRAVSATTVDTSRVTRCPREQPPIP